MLLLNLQVENEHSEKIKETMKEASKSTTVRRILPSNKKEILFIKFTEPTLLFTLYC